MTDSVDDRPSNLITREQLERYRAKRKKPALFDRIPAQYRDCTRAGWNSDPDPMPGWNPQTHWALLIVGDHGNGKTHAATVIWREHARWDARWYRSGALMREIYAGFGGDENIESTVVECSLLLLDDLGREKAGEDATSRLAGLLCDRCDAMLPTIITTNLDMDALKEWDSAVGDRLAGSGVMRVEFIGRGRR